MSFTPWLDQIDQFLTRIGFGLSVLAYQLFSPFLGHSVQLADPRSQIVAVSSTASAQLVTPVPTTFATSPLPTSSPRLVPHETPSGPNYELEPDPQGREGFYIMKAKPDETMATVEELNQAVNLYRQTHNLNQLQIEDSLCLIANERAHEIQEEFSHDRFGQHVQAGDYNHTGFSRIGENLWQGSFSGVHIVEFGWDKSPGHRANLLGDWSKGCAGVFQTNAVFIFYL